MSIPSCFAGRRAAVATMAITLALSVLPASAQTALDRVIAYYQQRCVSAQADILPEMDADLDPPQTIVLKIDDDAIYEIKVTPEGKMIPVCSGLRSPGGVGANAEGAMFAIESQGPWNGCCSLKHLKEGGFLGHPASYNWYPFAPGVKAPELEPNSDSRMGVEKKRVKELVPPAVMFPYIKMGRSISGFRLDDSGGKFGPFGNQIFLGDYTLSLIMRATTERINGVWQGACYPFREGLGSGIMNVEFSPAGQLVAGGFTTNTQWPVRSILMMAEPVAGMSRSRVRSAVESDATAGSPA